MDTALRFRGGAFCVLRPAPDARRPVRRTPGFTTCPGWANLLACMVSAGWYDSSREGQFLTDIHSDCMHKGGYMFGIGSTELLVILLVALVVLGPKSLSGVSRSLGKALGEFRRVSTDFQRTLNAEVAREEEKKQCASADNNTTPHQSAAGTGAQGGTTATTAAAGRPATETLETTATLADQSQQAPADSPLAQSVASTKAAAESNSMQTAAPAGKEQA